MNSHHQHLPYNKEIDVQHLLNITLSLINNKEECDRHSILSHKWKYDKDIDVTTYLYRCSSLAVFWFQITNLIVGFCVFYNQEKVG